MESVILKDNEEYEREKSFARKYVSPYFRSFYLFRYQIYRFSFNPRQSRKKAMKDMNLIWTELKEVIVDEKL